MSAKVQQVQQVQQNSPLNLDLVEEQERVQRQDELDDLLIPAAVDGRVSDVAQLILQKATVDICVFTNPEETGWEPLLVVVGKQTKENEKCLEVMQLLIQAKADVNAKDSIGPSAPLFTMITSRCGGALRLLLESHVDLSGDNFDIAFSLMELIKLSWEKEGGEMETMLLTKQPPQFKLNRELASAALEGRVDEVAQLIQKKANVDTDVLHSPPDSISFRCRLVSLVALKKNDKCLEVMRLLIEARASPNPDQPGYRSSERELIEKSHREAFRLLFDDRSSTDKKDNKQS